MAEMQFPLPCPGNCNGYNQPMEHPGFKVIHEISLILMILTFIL